MTLVDCANQLSIYVSNTDSVEQNTEFMLTNYPKLKQTINAHRNLASCFRELDFFSPIPTTCDRLREEMHTGEYTAHEWSTLRSVCREHVELEIFLIEAEAGMKKRLEEEEIEEQAQHVSSKKKGRRKDQFDLEALTNVGLEKQEKNLLIDKCLSEHVENVWELGDEIRIRIMNVIASAFELAINNPSGMVALVEAVEVYDTANEEYRAVQAGMKKALEEEEIEEQAQRVSSKKKGRRKDQFDLEALTNVGLEKQEKNLLIDKFLSEHVENVWELGDEIRIRIMNVIASAFELAINNPSGMVALVEAVEVYDTANEEYRAVHGVEAGHESQTLRFRRTRFFSRLEVQTDISFQT